MKKTVRQILAILLPLLPAVGLATPLPDPGLEAEPTREQPVIVVEPLEIELTLPPGTSWQRFLEVRNEGEPGSVLHYVVRVEPAGPNDRSIDGSTLTVDPSGYVPGEIQFFYFTAFNASQDFEWLDEITMSFPPGVEVLGSTDFDGGTFGPLVSDHAVGDGAMITWFDANGGYGNIWGDESAVASVVLLIPEDIGDVIIGWTMSGDDFGDLPHDVTGELVLTAPGGKMIEVLEPNGGELWPVGEIREVRWNTIGQIPGVNVRLSRNMGESWELLAGPIENTGSFDWLVNGPLSTQCLIEVSAEGSGAADESDGPLTVYRGADWLDLPITAGELPAGEFDSLPILFDTYGLGEGVFAVSLVINSDAGPDVVVPLTLIVSESTGSAAPVPGFSLAPNYPNPFNPSTTISFSLPTAGPARLEVLDVSGRRLRMLASGRMPAGPRSVLWDGRDDMGRELPSGIYLYRLRAEAGRFTRKMLLTK